MGQLGGERSDYRPYISFEQFGLIVGFDHGLRVAPEVFDDPERGPRKATYFLVSPQRELYLGLQFVPRIILSVVARGLETYLEAPTTFSEEQRALIEHGVFRLNRFVATGER